MLSYFLAYPVTYPLPCTYLTWSAFFGRCWISTGTRIEVSRIGRHLCRCSAPAVLSRAAAVRERLSAAHKTARERLLHLSRHLQRLLPLSTRVPVLAILLGVIPGAEARHAVGGVAARVNHSLCFCRQWSRALLRFANVFPQPSKPHVNGFSTSAAPFRGFFPSARAFRFWRYCSESSHRHQLSARGRSVRPLH